MIIQSVSLIDGRIRATIAGRASSILIPIASRIRIRRVTLSTIIGKAVSIGKIRTMMDMMTEITAFGMKGNFDTSFIENEILKKEE